MKLISLAAGTAAALTLAGAAAAAPRHVARTPFKVQVSFARHSAHASVRRTHGGNGIVGGSFLTAATAYLQIDRATLVADLRAGQSLAQVATASGKTADGLVTALLAPAKLRLDAAVAAGRITPTQETTILSRLQTALTALVNKTLPVRPVARPPHLPVLPGQIIQGALSYLGLDLKTAIGDLRAGQTLAQIAVAQNKTAAGLVDAIVAPVKTRLDAQVAAGKLTAAQESTLLATLTTNVTAFVNGSR